jgi:AraC-like DNA-binding protein
LLAITSHIACKQAPTRYDIKASDHGAQPRCSRFSSRRVAGMFSNFAVALPSNSSRRTTVRPPTEHHPATGFEVLRRNPRYRMAAAHTHSNIEVNFLQKGHVDYLHGGVARTVEAGRVAVFWAGVPHQTVPAENGGEGIWMTLPLAWLLQWELPRDFAGRLLAGEFFQFEFEPEVPERWLRYFKSGDADERAVLPLDVHAWLARLALTLSPAKKTNRVKLTAAGQGGDQHIARVTAYIAAHYDKEDLTIDDIARVVNLRPHYLTTLFKRRCHVTLWEYVTRLRVSHAQRLLVTTDLRVLDVALESGFSSLAPFYNAFARYCGLRPLAFRKKQGETGSD